MKDQTNILPLPKALIAQAMAASGLQGVDMLCAWWNSIAPVGRATADHFGIYALARKDSWRSVYNGDQTIRFSQEFAVAASSAALDNTLLEFRRSSIEKSLLVSYDLAGQPIECVRAAPNTFRLWAAQSLAELQNVLPETGSTRLNSLPVARESRLIEDRLHQTQRM